MFQKRPKFSDAVNPTFLRITCFLFLLAVHLLASVPTTTTLTVSSNSVALPTAITLTAAVQAGGNPLTTPGLVSFCNALAPSCQGPALLGTAQLNSNGIASVKLVLPRGSHSIKAVFAGTVNSGGSSSIAQSIIVTGTAPTTTTLAASGSPGNYTLTATVSGTAGKAPTGNVSFLDTLNYAKLGSGTLQSSGPAGFNPVVYPNSGTEPDALAVGDFNKDGLPDVAVASLYPDSSGNFSLTILLSGGTTKSVILPSTASNPAALAVADFNNDGNPDLAITSGGNASYVTIMFGDGTGGFTVGPAFQTALGITSIAVGDFNHDGNADLVVANQFTSTVVILLGDGQGEFTPTAQTLNTASAPMSVAVGDFNNDGNQDLAIASYYSSSVTILLGDGKGNFSAPTSTPPTAGIYAVAVAIGDFNADGNQDLAVVNQFSSNVTILLGNGNGGFAPPNATSYQPPVTGTSPDSVAIGDFNGDGIPDLAVASFGSNSVTIFYGAGDGTFPNSLALPTGAGTAPHAIVAADFNADGLLDVALADSGAAETTILLNGVISATATLSGVVVLSGPNPPGAPHNVDATYSGDATYSPSTSGTVALASSTVQTTLTLALNTTQAIVGGTIQLTATVSPVVGEFLDAGTVTFYDGQTIIGVVPIPSTGVAVLNYTVTSPGANTFQAAFNSGSDLGIETQSNIVTVLVPSNAIGPLPFVPMTPCRVVDTRNPAGPFGGPALAAGSTRTFPIPLSSCNIPSTAVAYSFNVTVVPRGQLQFLTLWPAGQNQPLASTLNSFDGRIVANAAIVAAGTAGGVSVFATDETDVILDIDGYFVANGTVAGLMFIPLKPCRVVDTREANGPLGGPIMAAGSTRSFSLAASQCGIPANAAAYSLNVTVVPTAQLGYLTLWPSGTAQPNVSTLNSPNGQTVANAAIVPAGSGGAVSIFVTDQTQVIIDVNGYFATTLPLGNVFAFTRFSAITPCRVVDTRNAEGGSFGAPSLSAGQTRTFAIPAGACAIPMNVSAYSFNVTVVPQTTLGYLTLWPAGQTQPTVSTLNSLDGQITANAAIVPAGTGGAISVFATDQTDVILDINGYFTP